MNSPIQQVKDLIGENRTSEAIALLISLSKKDKEVSDVILLISSSHRELVKSNIKGTIDSDKSSLLQRQINDRILESLNFFDSQGNILPRKVFNKKNTSKALLVKYLIGIFLSGLALILIEEFIIQIGDGTSFAIGVIFFIPLVIVFVALVVRIVLEK